MVQSQYHHYIPRFILKSFSDEYDRNASPVILPDIQTISTSMEAIQTKTKPKSKRRHRRKSSTVVVQKDQTKSSDQMTPVDNTTSNTQGKPQGKPQTKTRISFFIRTYDLVEDELGLKDVDRMYGVRDMYKDPTSDDCMYIEKCLSKLESTSSTFIHKIRSESKDLFLTRAKLRDFKKFLAIMSYRGEFRKSQYDDMKFDFATLASITKHMRHNGITNIPDVWFGNLKWLVTTDTEEIIREFLRTSEDGNPYKDPFKAAVNYKGPIHFLELADFAQYIHCYVCIWEAEEGSEFIITDGCFSSFEGCLPFAVFHYIYVISPKYAVVLVNRMYMTDSLQELRRSWFEKYHANPDTVYVNGNPRDSATWSEDDIFKYRRIFLPRKDVWLVKCISLDEQRKYLSFKSSISMLKCLRYYDKVKHKKFPNRFDYSDLKKKIFQDLNRTHSST